MADISETTQYVREAPDIEAYKKNLMAAAAALKPPALPAYQVSGMTQDQKEAIAAGREGIGAFAPYLQSGYDALQAGQSTLGEAADTLRGADTRNQFAAAQTAMNNAAVPAAAMGKLADAAGAGIGQLSLGSKGMGQAQDLALAAANQPGFDKGIGTLGLGAAQGAKAAAGLGAAPLAQAAGNVQAAQMGPAQTVTGKDISAQNIQAAQMGPAQQVQTQSFGQEGTAQSMMSPYMDAVVKAQQRDAMRQAGIMGTQRAAQATKSGAFGGSRQAIENAEAQRNLSTQLGDIENTGLQSAFQQAQGQFNTEQQARLAAQQSNQQAGLAVGSQNLNAQQQTAVQNAANQLQASGMSAQQAMQAALANQQAGLTVGQQNQSAQQQAALANQGVQQQTNLANQAMQGQYGQAGAQLGMQAAGLTQNVGQAQLGAANQQGQLGLQAANQYGQMAGQQAGLANQYANIASQQAGILGQQSQLQQQLGQGIGSLAGQQFGIGQGMAQGLGSLATQGGNLGVQQAALGQTAQQLGQNDVNFQYNLGAQQQRQSQAELDALRATKMQETMQPYQQLAFQSDIYKGAPSTQMAITTQNQPSPSPFQQIAGAGTAALGIAGAANAASRLF